jgi:cellulose synthase/poly-beta-1,6-N-acetylglucosamine synthase-like glycosyltransferase
MKEEFTIGIAAYNEAANIGRLLDRLLSCPPSGPAPARVLVVASGCTDRTEDIVREFSRRDGRIELISQPRRTGKASAVNLIISRAGCRLLVLMSADILPEPEALARLVRPFEDPRVGATAGRVIPGNRPDSFMGFYVSLFWRLHHRIAMQSFKAGEAVAFRRVFESIPADTATDETWIVQLVREKGLECRYVPEAVFHNRGPDNIGDFLKVRKRHLIGYYHLLKLRPDWRLPDTMDNRKVLGLLWQERPASAKDWLFILGAVLLEAWARALARCEFHLGGKNPFIWETARSTKSLGEAE